MQNKNLLKHFLIIVSTTIIFTFLANKYICFGACFTPTLTLMVLIVFGLTCTFMHLFKEKIKSFYIFLFVVIGIILALALLWLFLPYYSKKFALIFVFSMLLIGVLFGYGISAIKNKFVKTSFWFIGIFYMQVCIMNESDLEIIDWIMYIPAFILGIWACKKYSYAKKLLFLPLLLWVLNAIFVILVWGTTIILNAQSFEDISFGLVVYQVVTFFALWLAYCCGFWFVKAKKIFVKILLAILVVLFALFILKSPLRILITQRFANNSWTGEVSKPAKLSEIEFFTDSTLNKITVQDLQKELYVLDFYNKHCGNCFAQMPKFQQFAEKYKEKTEISFYAVNVFADTTDIAEVQRYLEKRNIDIPMLFISKDDEKYIQAFNYQLFPQYNIVKNDTIIFDGYFEILDFFESKYLK